jgi:hypothetical protein
MNRRLLPAVLLTALFFAGPASAQVSPLVRPSVYGGVGAGTHLGGRIGAGTEIRIGRYVSANAAVGTWPEAMQTNDLRGPSPADFDLGVKVYPFAEWLYAGINYGIIQATIETVDRSSALREDGLSVEPVQRLRETRGFTFSLGARTPSWNQLYASAYLGVTSNAEVNRLRVFDRSDVVPRVGLMVGVELW